jgi:ABC-type antimicrobial peptide transport system permease subunit
MMMRKYKSWKGLALVTLLGLIIMFALLVLLISDYLVDKNTLLLIIIILLAMVVGIAYVNFVTLQLNLRPKEFFVRKLLGATNKEIITQLLLESIVLSVFLVVSGMVLAELVSPLGEKVGSGAIHYSSITILGQISVVVALVLPVGLLTFIFPVRTFLNYINRNFSKLSQHHS